VHTFLTEMAAPTSQTMDERTEYSDLFNTPGLLVRQKLDVREICCPCCPKANRYKISPLPSGTDVDWSDSTFKSAPFAALAAEESGCCHRICCQGSREFTIKIHLGDSTSGSHVLTYDRPWNCTYCPCCCPQEIIATNSRNEKIGTVKQDCRCFSLLCCCGKDYYSVLDKDDNKINVIQRDVCCTTNMCAPNCCCRMHHFAILDAQEEKEIGSLANIFPGCNCRGMCTPGLVDNYRLIFPQGASTNQKATLLAGLFLIDYIYFENSDDPKSHQEPSV